jgi:hypothetical protein
LIYLWTKLGRANGFDDAYLRQSPTSREKANCTANHLTITQGTAFHHW